MKSVTYTTTRFASFICTTLALAAIPSIAQAVDVYSFDFENTTSGNLTPASIGWQSYATNSATDVSDETTYVYDTTADYLSTRLYSTMAASVVFSSTSVSLSNVSSISFNANQLLWAGTTMTIRIAVLTSSSWIVTDQTYTPSTESGYTTYTFTFTTDANAWRTLTVTEDESMSISSTTLSNDLDSSDILGIGLYVEGDSTSNGVVRVDQLDVSYTIPEASSTALSIGLMSILVCLAYHRKISSKR